MPFLAGSLAFERFWVSGFEGPFSEEHIELLGKHAAGRKAPTSDEAMQVGFLGGSHLFDYEFEYAKNIIHQALHCGVRIDSNQIPSAIRNAWLQMELTALLKESGNDRPTKAQRKEAKEAVEQRCEVEAQSGKYRKEQPFPMLWDFNNEMLYFGGSAGNASGHCLDLVESVFGVEARHVSSGWIAQQWALEAEREAEMDAITPTDFLSNQGVSQVAWANEHSTCPDFLGNEFLLWLWWTLENDTDTFELADSTKAVVMLTKTLSLECPRGEFGKETISAESPIALPEAKQAIRTGKLPRKAGLAVISNGRQYDLVLQAESFAISSAKIKLEEEEDFQVEDRIDAIRQLASTIDGLFHLFCDRRTSKNWVRDQDGIHQWLLAEKSRKNKAA